MPPHLYVSGNENHALVIIDACPTCNPALVGVIRSTGLGTPPYLWNPGRVSVYGNYAYVPATAEDCLTIIDISDPAHPAYVSRIGGAGPPNYLDIPSCCHVRNNGLCYVGTLGDDSLVIIDVSDPAHPALVGVARGAGAPTFLGNPATIYVDDNLLAYLACAGDNSLTIYDVSDPTAPVFRGNIAGAPNFLTGVADLAIRGIYAYTVSPAACLAIFDISNPAVPIRLGNICHACLNQVWSISILGNYAYTAAQGSQALGIFNIANPAAPAFVSQLVDARFASCRGVIAPEDTFPRAYILGSDIAADSVCRLDVANPAAPVFVQWLQGAGAPNYLGTPQHITQGQTFLPIVQTRPATEVT